MHDTLDYLRHEPVHRSYHHGQMTFSMIYAYSESFLLPISHDEVVHGKGSMLRKMPGDRWQQLANLRAYFAFMWAHPGKQLLFMGCEFGQDAEWAEARELDWWLLDQPGHRGCSGSSRDLNEVYRRTPALYAKRRRPRRLPVDRRQRRQRQRALVRPRRRRGLATSPAWSNFAAVPHHDYRIGLPAAGPVDRGAQHRRRDLRRARGSATSARCTAAEWPSHGLPASATHLGARRWARSGCGTTRRPG